jgi:hypothetical protein
MDQETTPLATRELSCPACRGVMRLVGEVNQRSPRSNLVIFQCDCGQIFTTDNASSKAPISAHTPEQ